MKTYDEHFSDYVKDNWLFVFRDDNGWYTTHTKCVDWVIRKIRREGWGVNLTGDRRFMEDGTIRTYFTILAYQSQ